MSRPDPRATQLRRGVVELAVLGLLADGPRYGQQIVDELAGLPGLALTAGTVYPLVSRLLKAGEIASTWQESPVGPPRKYYRLTASGRASLASQTAAWRQVRDAVDHILKESR
ncbi:PadR family transcriptional regulator [Propioniciclava soli]|uniref:PadR family transcriptional regulator n=1 Tax=Propioniciclava soli TaxID=2775081 RepID=A0ABZ3C7Y7_9ACTN|nr:PadR family transcriptional regulator [Propioniciclava soli]